MAKFRKKPVVIEAVQWTGSNAYDAISFCGAERVWKDGETVALMVRTLEGDHRADPGDWIIRGVKGEFYPCKPDIFEMTYEPVNE